MRIARRNANINIVIAMFYMHERIVRSTQKVHRQFVPADAPVFAFSAWVGSLFRRELFARCGTVQYPGLLIHFYEHVLADHKKCIRALHLTEV